MTTPPTLDDIFTEPDADTDTFANLGPLAPVAGVWQGTAGADVHPVADGMEVETFHDQVGYLLWEPATETVMMTLAIPRGQVAMAAGPARAGTSRSR